ncbi:M1 family metallopeptidase [Pendulispora albinea]|uniref:M1 family metallopeptidase n=1 Tax=Pendulispora albinea TaxID=2741071 RepID=A0ABZ2LJV5_9BACT
MRLVRPFTFVLLLGACTPGSFPAAEPASLDVLSSHTAGAVAAESGGAAHEPFAADVPMLEHAEGVVDYNLHATLDPAAHTVHGTGTIQWRNTSDVAQSELYLHLYLNAFKNEKSVFLREPVGRGARGIGHIEDWGYIDVRRLTLHEGPEGTPVELWPSAELHRPNDDDETDVRVPLPRPVVPGETITLDVVFDDKLPAVVERTGYNGSFHMVAQWFPKVARLEKDGTWAHFPFHHLAEFYADYGSYDVTLDVPQNFVLGATGPAVESRTEGGRRIERHVQSDIHDFAWTAWDQFHSLRDTVDGVTVTLLFPQDYEPMARRELESLRFTIPHFGKLYGRYPYSLLTVVHPPRQAGEAGGMEYPTLITTGGSWYVPRGVHTPESVTVHEYGHQYFYGLLGSNEVAWPFLDEGLNSFAEQDALGAWLGAGSAAQIFGLELHLASVQAVVGNLGAHEEPVAQPAYAFSSGEHYGELVYMRAASILETLRRVYGDDIVFKAMGQYTRRWRFRHPVPDDLIASFAEVVGRDAASNLRIALFDKGWVDYQVGGVSNRKRKTAAGVYDRDGKRETITAGSPKDDAYEGWALITRRGTLVLPVDVDLVLEDGTRQRVHWDGHGDEVRFPYEGNMALRAAVVDPDGRVLLDEDRTNNHGATEPLRAPTRTLERTTYWAELLLQLLSP